MKFTQFLILLAVNILTVAVPTGLAVYLAVRRALRRTASPPRREKKYENVS